MKNAIMQTAVIDCFLSHNLGDDLFLLTLVKRYPHVRFIITADSSYVYLARMFANIAFFSEGRARPDSSIFVQMLHHHKPMNKRLKLISSADAMVTIGGSLYIESAAGKTLRTVIAEQRRFMRDIRFARVARHYFILGANFGPYHSTAYRRFYESFFRKYCDDVCFRDKYSAGLFRDLNVVRYAPDVLFNAYLPQVNKQRKIFISVVDLYQSNKFGTLTDKAKAYDLMILRYAAKYASTGYDVVFCSFSKPEGDENAVNRLLNQAKSLGINVRPLFYSANMRTVLEELASAEIVIGTRFHATILGLLAGAQVLPLIYSAKTAHVLEDMGFDLSHAIDLEKNDWMNLRDDMLPLPASFDSSAAKVQSLQQFTALDKFFAE